MTATADEVKAEVLAVAQDACTRRDWWSGPPATSPARCPTARVCMTPSSLPYEGMTVEDLVIVDLEGNKVGGGGSPSTEKALHLGCYQRYPEVGGVIHSHAPHASMFALGARADPGGDRGGRRLHRRRHPDLRLQDHRHRRARRRGGVEAGRPIGRPRWPTTAWCASASRPRTRCTRRSWSNARPRSCWGARALGRPVPIPDKVNANFGNVYEFIRGEMWGKD